VRGARQIREARGDVAESDVLRELGGVGEQTLQRDVVEVWIDGELGSTST
jgi:hypothetical protein